MTEKVKLYGNFKILILVFFLISSCVPYQYNFKKNIKVDGYIIYTTADLLDEKGRIVGPSPHIDTYFISKKEVSVSGSEYFIKNGSSLYELTIYPDELRKWFSFGDTIYYQNNKYIEGTFITKSKLLIKKKFKNNDNYYNQKGYRICLNGNDTLDIKMNYHFMLVNKLNKY